MFRKLTRLFLALLGASGLSLADDASIVVHADRVSHRVSRFTTGACIEDVNHEIYGGIYSQMVHGESFEEPARDPAPVGFTDYDGLWTLEDGVLRQGLIPGPSRGPKMVADIPAFSSGEVGVEVRLFDDEPGEAGLIVKVSEPRWGRKKFFGYGVGLRPTVLVFGRFRNTRDMEKVAPCEAPMGEWVPLVIKMNSSSEATSLEVVVKGRSVFTFEDRENPLPPGTVGLRMHRRGASYRNLWVKTDGVKRELPFKHQPDWDPSWEVSGWWRPVMRGSARAEFSLEAEGTFNGSQSQRVTFVSGDGEVGIENQSLNRWGMHFEAGKPYEGYVWVRADEAVDFHVALESGDGSKIYAETKLEASKKEWSRVDFTLTPTKTDPKGRFAIKLKGPGTLGIGHAFLQPGPWGRFKNLGLRKDIVDALIEEGITVLRYGGTMVNAKEYRWKKMIGPRDRRPPYRGHWYPYATNGFGIIDFIELCEAAGFECIPAFNIHETPRDMEDFVEYVNGPPESVWGGKRVEAGHPEPYRLKHIQIGNEQTINEEYWSRFKELAPAIWKKDPKIILSVGDGGYPPIEDPYKIDGRTLEVHKRILDLAKAHDREVWFDLHVQNSEPRDPDLDEWGFPGVRDMIRWLGKLSPGAKYKVAVFEENARNHKMRRALSHAHTINELQRLKHEMPILCAANCLQPYLQNDNEWDQGLLFFTPSKVWGQPSYYVTQMVSRNHLPLCVETEFESPHDDLDVLSRKSEDGKTLTLQVVNLDARRVKTAIRLEGFTALSPVARLTQLKGELDAINPIDDPERIVPWERNWKHGIENGEMEYTFPPHSFTILRFE